MTRSAMGKKCVALGLAMCLVLPSFHNFREVSCQVDGSTSEIQSSRENHQYSAMSSEETSSVSRSVEAESEAVSDHEKNQSSSTPEKFRRIIEEYNKQAGSNGVNKYGENDAEKRKQLEEMERIIEEQRIQGGESVDDENDKYRIYYGHKGEKESDENRQFISEAQKTETEATSMESINQQYASTKSHSATGITGSLGIGQSGMWRCIDQDKNGVKEEDSIVIPKYDLDAIIKEESAYQGSSSKTSSLITSLTKIVDEHKKGLWSTDLHIGKVTSKVTSEKLEMLKEALKKYRGIQVSELVARSDFEEILTMAARYEELSKPSVTYISRLATYGAVIKEGLKASQRVQTMHQRVKIQEKVAMEKQEKVDAEFESVKAVAQKGDALHVKIFAMKKLVSELEAEKEGVDMEFQKIVANLSRVLEEATEVYEKYHVVVSEWKKEQASVEYSHETIDRAEVVWVQFLSTL